MSATRELSPHERMIAAEAVAVDDAMREGFGPPGTPQRATKYVVERAARHGYRLGQRDALHEVDRQSGRVRGLPVLDLRDPSTALADESDPSWKLTPAGEIAVLVSRATNKAREAVGRMYLSRATRRIANLAAQYAIELYAESPAAGGALPARSVRKGGTPEEREKAAIKHGIDPVIAAKLRVVEEAEDRHDAVVDKVRDRHGDAAADETAQFIADARRDQDGQLVEDYSTPSDKPGMPLDPHAPGQVPERETIRTHGVDVMDSDAWRRKAAEEQAKRLPPFVRQLLIAEKDRLRVEMQQFADAAAEYRVHLDNANGARQNCKERMDDLDRALGLRTPDYDGSES